MLFITILFYDLLNINTIINPTIDYSNLASNLIYKLIKFKVILIHSHNIFSYISS